MRKRYWTNKEFLLSVTASVCILLFSLILNYAAGSYATRKASNPVSDIILDNLPVVDVDEVFVYGTVLFWLFVAGLMFYDPKRMPYMLKSIALFTIIRSIFVSLTHIGPFPDQLVLSPRNILQKFTFGGDLFFSGHTGLPFLLALLFWNERILRIVFLLTSFVFAGVVLLGHLHYSIDVFAAFFITFAIYHISQVFFKKDRHMFSPFL